MDGSMVWRYRILRYWKRLSILFISIWIVNLKSNCSIIRKFHYLATFVSLLVQVRESLTANRIETVSNHFRVKVKEEKRRYECKLTRIFTRHSPLRVRNRDETTLDKDASSIFVSGERRRWRGKRKVVGMANGKSLKERGVCTNFCAFSEEREADCAPPIV